MKRGRTEIHTFYCIRCGHSIPLARKLSNQKEPMHRKKLYCPFCNVTINMVECRTEQEVLIFKENFEMGVYKEDAEKFIPNGGNSGLW